MTEVISLNEWKEPNWTYLLKTFVNMCGKCGKRQMNFQTMEDTLLEMEKVRMRMFFENNVSDDEEEDTYFDLKEMKEHLKAYHPMRGKA